MSIIRHIGSDRQLFLDAEMVADVQGVERRLHEPAPQPNRIFINNGGAQGGTAGTFSQQTNTRFAGVPNDTSRDIEFADFENDSDFDLLQLTITDSRSGSMSLIVTGTSAVDGSAVTETLEYEADGTAKALQLGNFRNVNEVKWTSNSSRGIGSAGRGFAPRSSTATGFPANRFWRARAAPSSSRASTYIMSSSLQPSLSRRRRNGYRRARNSANSGTPHPRASAWYCR